jgi:hypothetical protein
MYAEKEIFFIALMACDTQVINKAYEPLVKMIFW